MKLNQSIDRDLLIVENARKVGMMPAKKMNPEKGWPLRVTNVNDEARVCVA